MKFLKKLLVMSVFLVALVGAWFDGHACICRDTYQKTHTRVQTTQAEKSTLPKTMSPKKKNNWTNYADMEEVREKKYESNRARKKAQKEAEAEQAEIEEQEERDRAQALGISYMDMA